MVQFIMDNWRSIIEVLASLGVVVEISPIKVYPLRWIGNRINADLKKEIDMVNEKIDNHIEDSAKKNMMDLRHTILDFSDRIKEGAEPSKDIFAHIFEAIDDYHQLIEDHNLTNGMIDVEVEIIKKAYLKLYYKE